MKKIQRKPVEASEQGVAKRALKRALINISVFLILMFATFWFIFKDQDLNEILDVTRQANGLFIALGVLCMFGYFMMEAWNISTLLKSFGEKVSLMKALKFTFIGFFFCSVTPGASGGQPLEIYYMTREKISGANATLAILIQTCGIQFAVTIFGIICAIIGHSMLGGAVLWLFIIGLIINGAALLILLLCIFRTNIIKKILQKFIGFLARHKLISAEKWKDKIDTGLDKYQDGSAYIKKHRSEFVTAILKTFCQMTFFFLIPFCVYKAFNLSGYNIFTLFTMQSILFVATSGLPLPGAIGASESVFLSLYGAVFGEGLLSSAMLLNRGINFYWFVIVSMIVVLLNMILKKNGGVEITPPKRR